MLDSDTAVLDLDRRARPTSRSARLRSKCSFLTILLNLLPIFPALMSCFEPATQFRFMSQTFFCRICFKTKSVKVEAFLTSSIYMPSVSMSNHVISQHEQSCNPFNMFFCFCVLFDTYGEPIYASALSHDTQCFWILRFLTVFL